MYGYVCMILMIYIYIYIHLGLYKYICLCLYDWIYTWLYVYDIYVYHKYIHIYIYICMIIYVCICMISYVFTWFHALFRSLGVSDESQIRWDPPAGGFHGFPHALHHSRRDGSYAPQPSPDKPPPCISSCVFPPVGFVVEWGAEVYLRLYVCRVFVYLSASSSLPHCGGPMWQ